MQTTTNIGLKTYEANDPTDWLGEFNYNMNKIDTAVGAQNDAIDVIEETAGTAVTTANTASDTASEALQTANTKASIDDSVASASTTYSSNKINELISGIQPGTEIDDTVTSTSKTWSSSKINSSKMSIPNYNSSNYVEYPGIGSASNFNYTADTDGWYVVKLLQSLETTSGTSVNNPAYMSLRLELTVNNYAFIFKDEVSSFSTTPSAENVYLDKTFPPIYLKAGDTIRSELVSNGSNNMQHSQITEYRHSYQRIYKLVN